MTTVNVNVACDRSRFVRCVIRIAVNRHHSPAGGTRTSGELVCLLKYAYGYFQNAKSLNQS